MTRTAFQTILIDNNKIAMTCVLTRSIWGDQHQFTEEKAQVTDDAQWTTAHKGQGLIDTSYPVLEFTCNFTILFVLSIHIFLKVSKMSGKATLGKNCGLRLECSIKNKFW